MLAFRFFTFTFLNETNCRRNLDGSCFSYFCFILIQLLTEIKIIHQKIIF